jgi:hypothetical protein
MKRYKFLGTLILGGALIAPAGLMAFQQSESTTTTTTTTETHRYYDPGYKEYHEWDSNEDRAYRMYLQETKREYQEFPKTTVTQQTEYWKWRHNHPNKTIFKSETHEEEQR